MPTIDEAIKKAYQEGKKNGILPIDLRLLIMHDEGLSEPIEVLYKKDEEMKNYPLFLEQVQRLNNDEPVEYIINEANFLGRRLYVDHNVLIPRSETEELVANITENISDYYDARNYLVCADIGTGSGAIALALKDAFPNWIIVASDISEPALEVAKRNITESGSSIETYLGDALNPYIEKKTNLDIIVSNPPYIIDKDSAQSSVRDFEPSSALWMEKGKSVYESIFKDYKKVKRGSLLMCFEISPDLQDWLIEMMKKYLEDYEYRFIDDLNKLTRFLFVYCK
ncbi:MAG: peptide chain release factor N(5)-glutamine methyltransferase [Bacilli bacterium]|jgi:release factor glutamine methyltransferase|nr:peptide chain release factor N(5)-glutamine methyltransferase [Bacilli bacterium]MCH4210165.1 peptide chain release factor N(5)-glutamine methyltransferase [Bacilli bacterium]MCH4229085.1 peptide chain release factor N(5)-glutamine methyltransferase [Bacilli bacterium]MCH4278263.1 peptide chain release factor N(5)-glutamine methyltransferase [Bacilli bacterium]MCI2055405.1 peptide chain release factor N(5)-glutamine methyltransferase [Bacilli bacterium]